MTAKTFHNIYQELIDENPLAVRAVLKVLAVEFTDTVPTLAVTSEQRPRLLVNLTFLREHCRTEAQVKAVVCHEFLHVLLRHTERFTVLTPAEHLAVDAVINAIIHRSLGPDYSSLMSSYYADERGIARLLRPPTLLEQARMQQVGWGGLRVRAEEKRVLSTWAGPYDGRLVADDIRDLARDLTRRRQQTVALLLGDHESLARETSASDGNGAAEVSPGQGIPDGQATTPLTGPLADALDAALKAMNGTGVFRSPKGRGIGAVAYRSAVRTADTTVDKWRRETYAVLRRHLLPDPRSIAREPSPRSFTLPVLSPGDRRAALRSLWSPFLPDAQWETEHTARAGSAPVYLDVSGSMNAEMPVIQQLPDVSLIELTARIVDDLRGAYASVRAKDRRWTTPIEDIELLINPNGALLNGGSDGDNGQTGRKLVVDYYGPRVAIGGGALSGKDLSHIDRAGAYAARHAALHAVQTGAGTCRITVAYAPNRDVPLDVVCEMDRRGEQVPPAWFAHSAVRERYRGGAFVAALGAGGHFVDSALAWNQGQ